jgi:uncharacterized protein YdhG (YjbR/CyaY superfamily)
MKEQYATVENYIASLDEEKRNAIIQLRNSINKNLPKGFEETISYGMISYCVPHSIYPKGYHCNPKQALPFISIAAQKNFIAVYHMGLYADKDLHEWFLEEWKKKNTKKLDMGKSCLRFKKPEDIPHELLGKLFAKMSVKEWINLYEKSFVKK